jgi:hypothetical protein
LGKPVQNFIHPFVEGLSDKIVENLGEGAEWIRAVLSNPNIAIKGIEDIGEAMQYYKTRQLHKDAPMMEMINSSKELEKRMNRLLPQVEVYLK